MGSYFVDLPDGRPDRGMQLLDEVFHLETQLRDAETATTLEPGGASPAPP
jgi:hypothetical protein